ncbi:MAG TPA: hypothetical protein VK074_04990, partial [Fodinibius sp.]|nr:hypothetical protein [Fodinibius sp.]
MKKRDIYPKLKRKIDLYVEGELDNEQVDELWSELINNSNALGYLKTAVDINEINDEEYEERVRITTQKRTLNYWYLSAALVLIAGAFVFLQIEAGATESVQPVTDIELN